jgi:hypothetical protein
MGQLNRTKLSRCGSEVCPVGAALPAKPRKFAGQHGKTLLRRLSRLDSELEMSRADLGARGEPLEPFSYRTNWRPSSYSRTRHEVELLQIPRIPESEPVLRGLYEGS